MKLSWKMILLVMLISTTNLLAGTVKIGVLAKNGPVICMKKWRATADYLTSAIPEATFEIVPLKFDDVFKAVQNDEVDYFLVNSSMFMTTKVKYGASAVATMINSRQGKSLKQFGGVIFTSADNDWKTLADIKGKSFMAVKSSSFGGWQMAYKELKDAGINPQNDFASLAFGGKHTNVVYAVINGEVDAGTVRTDTIERMVAAGDLDMEDITIINEKKHAGFPFVCSTALYPEWPLAATKGASGAMTGKIVAALTSLDKSAPAAKSAKIVGWSNSMDYSLVETLQKQLKVGAYK